MLRVCIINSTISRKVNLSWGGLGYSAREDEIIAFESLGFRASGFQRGFRVSGERAVHDLGLHCENVAMVELAAHAYWAVEPHHVLPEVCRDRGARILNDGKIVLPDSDIRIANSLGGVTLLLAAE